MSRPSTRAKVAFPFNEKGKCRWDSKELPKGKKWWCSDFCKEEYDLACGRNVREILIKRNKEKNDGRCRCVQCGVECIVDWHTKRIGDIQRKAMVDYLTPIEENQGVKPENARILCENCHWIRSRSASKNTKKSVDAQVKVAEQHLKPFDSFGFEFEPVVPKGTTLTNFGDKV
jgi:hypothetical protein